MKQKSTASLFAL